MGYVLEVNGLTKIYPSFELKPVNLLTFMLKRVKLWDL